MERKAVLRIVSTNGEKGEVPGEKPPLFLDQLDFASPDREAQAGGKGGDSSCLPSRAPRRAVHQGAVSLFMKSSRI
jgi:hypothetical protein